MGKAAKAKKRRSKAANSFIKNREDSVVDKGVLSDSCEDFDSDLDVSVDGIITEADNLMSIRVLNVLGQRLDIYESKSSKCLRTALFPLIQLQICKGSLFEKNLSNKFLDSSSDSREEFITRKLSVLTRTATIYSSDRELFLSPGTKSFRAALL